MMPRTAILTALLLPAAAGLAPAQQGQGVASTKHNLSVGGGDSRVCVFCHTPHNANPATPLWSRELPSRVYSPYSSSTMEARPGQPTHASKLCLSCHDGTIGLGYTLRGKVGPDAWRRLYGRMSLSTDLSDDHPVSFVYDSGLASKDRELHDPGTLAETPVRLDAHGQLQCTTCHDAHYTPYPKFLVVDNTHSRLCTHCHVKEGWTGSVHALSPAQWNGAGRDPWPHTDRETVAENACENCHISHAARHPERLLLFREEAENCLSCHGGTVARRDIASEVRKPFRHPVESMAAGHEPDEEPLSMPRHVACQDCHNPHAVRESEAVKAGLSGALAGVPGISITGAPVSEARHEYEICFRCHADGTDVPAPVIVRQVLQTNIRMKFNATNPSSHPVVAPGRNPDVPSLISPLDETSTITCTDCHNSDAVREEDEGGPRGPHGSLWRYLLAREYRTADGIMESYQAYALCYGCHDRMSILADQSFPEHRLHVLDNSTACSVCHDPHGISAAQGSETNHSNLINFDTSIVETDPGSGILRFEDRGTRTGSCLLKCHGVVHGPEEY